MSASTRSSLSSPPRSSPGAPAAAGLETMPLSRVCGILVLLSVGLISIPPPCHGGNILVFPIDGSHWINMKLLLEELHARGHSLTVIRGSNSWYIPEESPLYTSITIQMDEGLENFFDEYLQEHMKALRDGASILASIKITKDFLSMITQGSFYLDADIWLFRSDFVFDFPRPTMPNVIYIGGYQCKPAQPLPADLEQFVQSAGEHGVIIMTLGTLVNALPKEAADEIASVFAKMPQKVIWRHKGERPSTLGNNTLIVDWMPQRDLLGHPQTKVFVAHGGTNGVQEAIYHGVPVVGIPLFFDQFDNLVRLRDRGAAKTIQLGDLNGQSFKQGLQEVLLQDSYRQNMQRLSSLHRDQQ
ncbi:unnamed protein product [Pleuronectes platessa]|uniref:UDP-glucuronosyltransferase n=1 Tax=Pleuronectes platessa TaxID=8262 RepID=A0A9N7TT80_PLEPL|nr:unnamed protein product [Pleuronectes platessa]